MDKILDNSPENGNPLGRSSTDTTSPETLQSNKEFQKHKSAMNLQHREALKNQTVSFKLKKNSLAGKK
jgi:hypothetical protein